MKMRQGEGETERRGEEKNRRRGDKEIERLGGNLRKRRDLKFVVFIFIFSISPVDLP